MKYITNQDIVNINDKGLSGANNFDLTIIFLCDVSVHFSIICRAGVTNLRIQLDKSSLLLPIVQTSNNNNDNNCNHNCHTFDPIYFCRALCLFFGCLYRVRRYGMVAEGFVEL